MNKIPFGHSQNLSDDFPYSSAEAGGQGDANILQMVTRHRWLIMAFTVIATSIAMLVIRTLPARYTASAAVMIDARQIRVINAEQLLSNQMLDAELLHTEMASFGSIQLARAVVKKLALNTVPEYCRAAPRKTVWVDWLAKLTGRPTAVEPSTLAHCRSSEEDAAKRLINVVTPSNDGRSYVIGIEAQAGDPVLAAKIANAYADAFIEQRREERRQVTEEARNWLASYVARSGDQVTAADTAVAEYRDKYHLISVHGDTLASQSLSQLNAQLSEITSEIASKQSVASHLQGLVHDGDTDTAAPMLSSPLVQQLLIKETELVNRKVQLETQLGNAHPKVIEAAAQLAAIQEKIHAEIPKAVGGLSTEVSALNTRKAQLTSEIAGLQSRLGQQGDDDVQLQRLERDAESSRQNYQSSLTRLKEIEAEEGMVQSDAHLVAEALPPDYATYPRRGMMIVGAFLASLGVGAVGACGVGLLSRVFRDGQHFEQQTGVNLLGLFPRPPGRSTPQDFALDSSESLQAEALHRILAGLRALRRETAGFSEMRSGAERRSGIIIMVASALAGEGKTSLAVALGRCAETAGLSSALVDCDLRRPGVLTALGAPDQAEARIELAPSRRLIARATTDRRSDLVVYDFSEVDIPHPHRFLTSSEMRSFFDHLRSKYDLVLVDTPPLLPVVDGLTLAPLVDEIILLIDSQRTPRRAVIETLQMLRRGGGRLAGAVLTKVDLRKHASAYKNYGYFTASGAPRVPVPVGRS